MRNKSAGPYGAEYPINQAQPGDIIQISYDGNVFGHSLFVVEVTENEIFAAQHSQGNDCDRRPFSSYYYKKARLIRIEGVRR
jgi:hypothetical protein